MALAALSVLPGCFTPGEHREKADAAASAIIEATQIAALGRTEPFTIERPSETLRRRLMLDQNLPRASAASLDRADLEPIDHWPEDPGPPGTDLRPEDLIDLSGDGDAIRVSLVDALRIAAANSRDYQDQKEAVFQAALALSLACNDFNSQLMGLLQGDIDSTLGRDPLTGDRTRTTTVDGTASLSLNRRFQNGISLSTQIGVDVARLLTEPGNRSLSIFSDTSITIPLLRGASRHVVAEPLIQAERDVLYAILGFERFKRTFVVQLVSDYLNVLQQEDQVRNAEQNYRSLIVTTRELREKVRAGRIAAIELDQAVQDELRARNSWIAAIQRHKQQLDQFRIQLGLPTDARIALDRGELARLSASVREVLGAISEAESEGAADDDAAPPEAGELVLEPPGQGTKGPWEIDELRAVECGLKNRLDLTVALGRVYDAQRGLVVAADALRGEITLFGSASLGERRSGGSATLPDSTTLRTSEATYGGTLTIDPPLERTAERVAYRNAWIALERATRDLQELEDQVKLDVRSRLRDLLEAREGLRIQGAANRVAERRVASTRMFLAAGKAQTRDLLEAQEDLVAAQNDLTAALIDYRIAELQLQRDMGILQVGPDGVWTEVDPEELFDARS